ncbi:MAG: hypothetical protein ACR2H1_01875, partial [Limisphaerales bacterium]
AFVELEMGVLEPTTLEQLYAIPEIDPAGTRNERRKEFLGRQGGKIHIFRQQIPIRSAPR